MKNLTWLMLLLGILSLSSGSSRAWAQSGITAQNGRNVTCASDDGKRHLCRVDTSRGVTMTNQRSGSPCIQGQTWGYSRSGIWVDRGCRADFYLASNYRPGLALADPATGAAWLWRRGDDHHLLVEQRKAELLPGEHQPRSTTH